MNKRNYELTLNVTTGKIKIPQISIYNTDKGIFNIKLFLEKGEGKNIVKLTHDEMVNYKALFQAVKSKTKNYVELEGILDETENFFYYDLGSKFNDQVGVYNCQIFVTDTKGTKDNTTDDEIVTSVPFNYSVTASILTGLNAEITANPDLPVLKELINECKILMKLDSADMSVLNPFQKKEDNAINGTDKNIISNINNINSQIKDITHNTNSNTIKNTSAIATFIWDDCWLEDYTIIYPYMKSKGIKGCSACISTYIDENPQYMTLSQILEMQGYGWEFMVHTRTHGDLATFDYETQYREIVGCKNELLNKGVNVESIVYPLNSYNDTTLEITRKSLRAGFAYPNVNGDKINKMPINQFAIYRIATEEPLSTNKKYIDEAISKNAWIVFMGHGHYYRNDLFPDDSKWPGKFDQNLQNVKDNIEYCISNGITVKTAKEALNLFENKINLGDTAKGRFLVGADGSVDFDTSTISNIVYNDAGLDGITNETPASSFEKNKITITSVLGKDSGNFPIKNGATLITYNFNPSNLLNNEMAYQVLRSVWDGQLLYSRANKGSSGWNSWNDESVYFKKSTNLITASKLPTQIEDKKMTYSLVKTSDNAGFPQPTGEVIVLRDSSVANAYTSELFLPSNIDRIYKRRSNSNADGWESFEEYVPVINKRVNIQIPEIPANGVVYSEIEFEGVKTSSSILATCLYNEYSGMNYMINVTCRASGKLLVSVRNLNNTITPAKNPEFRVVVYN